jgi:hypothetical protein
MPESVPSLSPQERTGRRVGVVVFSLIVGALTANFSAQIIARAFGLGHAATDQGCSEGLAALVDGLDQARQSAAATAADGEQRALQAFRSALGPVWEHPHAVRDVCRASPQQLADFHLVERLRYAEEHAVRYESRGMAEERRKVSSLREALSREAASPGN